MDKALKGVRILESGRMFAAPMVGLLLGDMGAEVIRYEEPGIGDPLRHFYHPLIDGVGPYFLWSARNKKCITLNLRVPKGQDIFKKLVSISDVVTENFVPGTMAKWNLSYEDLKKVKSDIIMMSISSYGETGPYSKRGGVDHIIQAHSGLMSTSGEPDGHGTFSGLAVSDYIGGLTNTYATLIALIHKQKTGQGQWIDNSLLESSAWCMGHKILHYTNHGISHKPKGSRGFQPLSRSFPADDGDIFIMGGNAEIRRKLFLTIGRNDLVEDKRFSWDQPVDLGEKDMQTLDEALEAWTTTKTVKEIEEILVKINVMVAPVNNVADVCEDPHYNARGGFVEIEYPDLGLLKFQGPVPKLSLTPASVDTPPPLLGEHNDYVYGDLLSYSQDEIEQLQTEGVI